MFRSWKLGRAFGIGIYVHWTFWLLPLWVLYNTGLGGGIGFVIYILTFIAGVFTCVVLHELGHALMARHFGIRTRDITLSPIGGVARLERISEVPIQEFLIALAGPAVNVVIAGLLFGLLVLLGAGKLLMSGEGLLFSDANLLVSLLGANVMLVLFNLLPAFPMDGGRVLRAILAMNMDRLRATEIAARVGIVMAIIVAAVGLFKLDSPMLAAVAVFIFFAGQQELAMLRWQRARQQNDPMNAAPVIMRRATPDESGGTDGVWIVIRDGRPVRVVQGEWK